MNATPAALVLAALSFAVSFAVARLIGRWLRKRQVRDDDAKAALQSRQVRRARDRRSGRR